MAQEAKQVGIAQSWALLAFAAGKQMQLGTFEGTDGQFKSLIFTESDGSRCFVGFSSNLGELTSSEIIAQKHDLQVVKLDSGSYKLCRKGNSSWEDITL